MNIEQTRVKLSMADIEEIIYIISDGFHLAYYDDTGDYIDIYFLDDSGERQKRISTKKE